MKEPPKLDSGTAITLVASAWSLFWTAIATACIGYVMYLEVTQNISWDPELTQYLPTADVQKLSMMVFGSGMIATGLALIPLYQRDQSAAGIAPVSE